MSSLLSLLAAVLLTSLLLLPPPSSSSVIAGDVAAGDVVDVSGPQLTPWGDYGGWGQCPPGQFVFGVRLSVEGRQGAGDDTALNDVELLCRRRAGFGGSGGSQHQHQHQHEHHHDSSHSLPSQHLHSGPRPKQQQHQHQEHQEPFTVRRDEGTIVVRVPRAHGKYGGWGRWRDWVVCPQNREAFVVGVQVRVEPKQGGGDDTAANDVRLVCSGGVSPPSGGGGGGPWGRWTDPVTCPSGRRVCGMRTKIEKSRGGGIAFGHDDTAVNTIDIRCC